MAGGQSGCDDAGDGVGDSDPEPSDQISCRTYIRWLFMERHYSLMPGENLALCIWSGSTRSSFTIQSGGLKVGKAWNKEVVASQDWPEKLCYFEVLGRTKIGCSWR